MLISYYYKVCRSRMTSTKDSCFSFIIVFCISSVLFVRAEFSTSFLQEIEILEDEILTPIKSKPEGDALKDALINGTCPKYFTEHEFRCLDINGGCYCIVTDPRYWWSALHYCRQYGMELLSLETKEEEENVAKNLNRISDMTDSKLKKFYLTSGNRIYGNRSTWMWAGTGDIIPLETREIVWEKGEPSGTFGAIQEECLIWVLTFNETLTIHEWNDLSCTIGFYNQFICELQVSTPFL